MLILALLVSPRDTHHIPINKRKSWHAFFNLLGSSLFILCIYNRLGELLESGTRRPISRPKKERFFNRFTVKKQFLFHESKLFSHGIQYPNRYHNPRWEIRQTMKITHFRSTLITLTCRNSLINPVTNKFHFGVLVRFTNETGCESHTDQ